MAGGLSGLGRAAPTPATAALKEEAWEVEHHGRWSPLDAAGAVAVKEAAVHGKIVAAWEAHGSVFLVDFQTKIQVNTNTGRWFRIRPTLGTAEEPSPPSTERKPVPGEDSAEPASAAAAVAAAPAFRKRLESVLFDPDDDEPAPKMARRKPDPPPREAPSRPATSTPPPARRVPSDPPLPAAVELGPSGAVKAAEGNELLADIFEEMATVQRLKRDRFRAAAYRKASQAIRAHPEPIVSGAQAKAMEGIGAGMARRIDIVIATGELEELKELKKDSDVVALRELRSVHGIGAVRAAELIEKGVRSLADLRAAVASGHVHLDSVQTKGLRHAEEFAKRIPRVEATQHEAFLLGVRARLHPALRLQVCGSYRRERPDCGDIDVLISHPDFTTTRKELNSAGALLRNFVKSLHAEGYITDDLASGNTKYMGICRLDGPDRLHRRVDIRCLPWDQYHFGTLYFTGSAGLSIRMRLRAIDLGMTLSEYSLVKKDTGVKVAAASEKEIFEALGMAYLEPRDR